MIYKNQEPPLIFIIKFTTDLNVIPFVINIVYVYQLCMQLVMILSTEYNKKLTYLILFKQSSFAMTFNRYNRFTSK